MAKRQLWNRFLLFLRTDLPANKCCSCGTFFHNSLHGSHVNIYYYHQDLQQRTFHSGSRHELHNNLRALLLSLTQNLLRLVMYKFFPLAPSIFRASPFGRWVVTRSLAVSDFHGHRPAVLMDQHLLWVLGEGRIWHFNITFGSSRIAMPAYPAWPTNNLHSTRQLTKVAVCSYPFKVWE